MLATELARHGLRGAGGRLDVPGSGTGDFVVDGTTSCRSFTCAWFSFCSWAGNPFGTQSLVL